MNRLSALFNFLSGAKLSPTTPPPYLLKFRSSTTFIITTICIAILSDLFLYGIIVPVIPFALHSRAGIPTSQAQHYVSILLSVYGGALLVTSPIAGWFADRSPSRRVPLLIGLLSLLGSTLLLCLARTVALMIVGRALQGASAAIVWTVGQALLVDTVGHKQIGQMVGWMSLSMSMGELVSPLLAGVVYEWAGYYAVYYMGFALVVLDIFLRLIMIEKKIARQWLGDEETASPPQHSEILEEKTSTDTITSPELSTQAINIEPPPRISKHSPIFTLLTSTRLLTALFGCAVQAALVTSIDTVLPLFVSQTFYWNSTAAGLSLLACILPSFLAPLVGFLCDRYGPRYLCVTGFLLCIPFWILLRLVTHNSLSQKVLLCVFLAFIGVGLVLVMAPLMAEITYVVEEEERKQPGIYGANGAYAQAYGLFVMAFAAGTLVGPMWAGYMREAKGWGTMSWSLAVLSGVAAVPCAVWTGGLVTETRASGWGVRRNGEISTSNLTVDASHDMV